MKSTRCAGCQAVLVAGEETCSGCGELTPLGIEKERRLHRRARRRGVWRTILRDPTYSSTLFIAVCLILLFLVVVTFAYLVNARLI